MIKSRQKTALRLVILPLLRLEVLLQREERRMHRPDLFVGDLVDGGGGVAEVAGLHGHRVHLLRLEHVHAGARVREALVDLRESVKLSVRNRATF